MPRGSSLGEFKGTLNEIKTSKYLASTGYRCLFECVKQEGIEPVLGLVQDINNLPAQEILISQTIMGKENDLTKLARKNQDVIRYLKGHENELIKLSFKNQNVFQTLMELSSNIALLDLYLENARKLEALKVEKIVFGDIRSFDANGDRYYCEVVPKNDMELKYIHKCYTDGEVYPRLTEEQANNFKWWYSGYSKIPFSITNEHTFVLKTTNKENFHQHREIDIVNFAFDGSKLPTEEEVQSYEIPKELVKN